MFLDASHNYKDIKWGLDVVKNSQYRGDIIVLDDYTPSVYDGVVRAGNELCQNNGYSKFVVNAESDRGYLIAQKQ